jgi:hypothetical protein
VSASAVDQVVTGSVPQNTASQTVASPLAFITYTGSTPGAALPYYIPSAGGAAGTVNYVTLSDCPTTSSDWPCDSTILAPLVGVFSPDNTVFFVSTAGDNEIHYIRIPPTVNAATPPTDTQQISPALPACLPVASGGVDAGCTNLNPAATIVPATAIAAKPRSVT